MSKEINHCYSCGDDFCENCNTVVCSECRDSGVCSDCLAECETCGDWHCPDCLDPCPNPPDEEGEE